MGVDRRRPLGGPPRVFGGLFRDFAEEVVVREGGEEVADPLAEDRLVRDRHAAMELDAPPQEERVVRDLLHDGVLEAVPALTPLAGCGLEHEVGGDELVDRVGEARAAGFAKNAVAEALADD